MRPDSIGGPSWPRVRAASGASAPIRRSSCGSRSGSTPPGSTGAATLLLTDTDHPNGGLANASVAVARTGRAVCGLPCVYEPFGYTVAHDGVHTVLHELGHTLIGSVDQEEDDGLGHHDAGAVYDRPEGRTISPMGTKGPQNECGDPVDDADVAGVESTWSDCCLRHWRPLLSGKDPPEKGATSP